MLAWNIISQENGKKGSKIINSKYYLGFRAGVMSMNIFFTTFMLYYTQMFILGSDFHLTS